MIQFFKYIKRQIMIYKNGFNKIQCDLNKVIIFNNVEIAHPERLTIEPYVRLGHNCHIDAYGKITIKKGVILSSWVTILSSSHNFKNPKYLPFDNSDISNEVVINEGAWLAWGCTILPGVNIGKNSVVSAKSVVTKDVPENSIVAGIPAKIIGKRNISDELLESLDDEKFYQFQIIQNGMKRK